MEIIVPETVVLDGCEDAVMANFDASLARLRKAGAKVKRMKMPLMQEIMDLIARRGHILGAEALVNLNLIASFAGSTAFPRVLADFHLSSPGSCVARC